MKKRMTDYDRLEGRTYILSEGKLVDIPSKHGTCWQDGRVSWGHDSGWNSTKPKERNVRRAEVLEDDREDHVSFLLGLGIWEPIGSLVPVCGAETMVTTESPCVVCWGGKSLCWSCKRLTCLAPVSVDSLGAESHLLGSLCAAVHNQNIRQPTFPKPNISSRPFGVKWKPKVHSVRSRDLCTQRDHRRFFFNHSPFSWRSFNSLGVTFLSVFSSAIPSYIGFSLGEMGGTSC